MGSLGILDNAATQGLLNLPETITKLQRTNFRASRRIIQTLLDKYAQ
jgi:predicted nucleic acid-binding protein